MKIVMTMMVRDEIDIIAPVIEHHLAQGVDLVVVTDNASSDGTTEVLEEYARLGVVELHHDPEHRKQQGERVTEMARHAYTRHGADWVINGDADEFLAPCDRAMTVRACLEGTDLALGAFTVPVVNLVGPPAWDGSGLTRLRWRDLRSTEELVAVGIHAQPTPNAIHRGSPDVTVAQGNHYVSVRSQGQPSAEVSMEVFHLPWRSWRQFEQKVLAAGRGYEASPSLRPSRNHHGMADYRRSQAGRLREAFHLRMPQAQDLSDGSSFRQDDWLHETLAGLVETAHAPDLLRAALEEDSAHLVSTEDHRRDSEVGARYLALEQELAVVRAEADRLGQEARVAERRVKKLRSERAELRRQLQQPAPLRQDLSRVARRTGGALKRRLGR